LVLDPAAFAPVFAGAFIGDGSCRIPQISAKIGSRHNHLSLRTRFVKSGAFDAGRIAGLSPHLAVVAELVDALA
jgi:hypothetical protein